MPRYSTLLAAVGVLFLATSARAADVSVAVLGLEPVEVPESLAQQLTDALRQRASSTSGVRIVQGKDLIEVKMVFGCDGELPACMAQAGKTLGADKLLYGTIKKGASKNTVNVALKLLDVKTAVVEKFVNDTVQKRELAGSNVAGVAGRWFAQLVEVDTKPTLTVTSDPSGANVSVDGQAYGRTPLTLRELTPGAHSVTVTMAGRQPFTRSVELRPGGSHDVVATLEPEAPPVLVHKEPVKAPEPQPLIPTTPTPPPPPLRAEHPGRTAKIVAGVLVGAAVVTAAVAIYTWRTYTDLETTSHNDLDGLKSVGSVSQQDLSFFNNPTCNVPADLQGSAAATKFHNDCTSGNNYANATTGLWVATGALAAAGVVSFVIGDRQAAKAKEKNVSVLRQTLRVAPVFSTRGGGLTAAFEF
jgi:hypothetical protein